MRFNSLRDVVVFGLITCERVVLGNGAKVLTLAGAHKEFAHHIVIAGRKDRMMREKVDRKEKWRSRSEPITQHERKETTHGM